MCERASGTGTARRYTRLRLQRDTVRSRVQTTYASKERNIPVMTSHHAGEALTSYISTRVLNETAMLSRQHAQTLLTDMRREMKRQPNKDLMVSRKYTQLSMATVLLSNIRTLEPVGQFPINARSFTCITCLLGINIIITKVAKPNQLNPYKEPQAATSKSSATGRASIQDSQHDKNMYKEKYITVLKRPKIC